MVLATSQPFEVKEYSVEQPHTEAESQEKIEVTESNPFKSTEKVMVTSNSAKNYQNDVQTASMFDKNMPMSESDQKF